jgi:hypothetical protein
MPLLKRRFTDFAFAAFVLSHINTNVLEEALWMKPADHETAATEGLNADTIIALGDFVPTSWHLALGAPRLGNLKPAEKLWSQTECCEYVVRSAWIHVPGSTRC